MRHWRERGFERRGSPSGQDQDLDLRNQRRELQPLPGLIRPELRTGPTGPFSLPNWGCVPRYVKACVDWHVAAETKFKLAYVSLIDNLTQHGRFTYMTNRMDHTPCDHSRDLAGRTACRKGMALVAGLRLHDHIHTTDGRFFSVVHGVCGGTTEIRVKEWTRDGGWDHHNPVWMYAADFVGATIELDPRNH